MSGEVRLTEDEQQLADKLADAGPTQERAEEWLREIIAARLARVEALAEEWATRRHTGVAPSAYAEEVFAALAPQPAPEVGA